MQRCFLLLTLIFAVGVPPSAMAGAVGVGPVTIKRIRTGWDADQFAIETNEAITNPANCPTADGYMAQATQAGYKEHYAAVLSALYAGRPISVIVSNSDCAGSRPRIMGIYLSP